MAILKYGTRFGTIGGKITSRQSANLIFRVKGPSFLQWFYNGSDPYAPANPPVNPNGYIYFSSTVPNSAKINYGDGVIEEYDFFEYNGMYYLAFSSQIGSDPFSAIANFNPQDNHVFLTESEDIRSVSISIKKPEGIRDLVSSYIQFWESLPAQISNLPLVQLRFRYLNHLTNFPFEWYNIKTIQILELTHAVVHLLPQFPLSFLGFEHISELATRNIFDLSDLDSSNARRIGDLGPSLTNLNLSASQLEDIPEEWAALTGLSVLNISLNNFVSIPDMINGIPSITRLIVGSRILENWSNLNLPSLNRLELDPQTGATGQGVLSPDFGNTLLLCPLLKIIQISHSFATQADFDTFIDNIYTFVIDNAPISGIDTDQGRHMSIVTYIAAYPTNPGNYLPTGTYQQPAGYVQGSANGSPASQFEKVWVLVNQYDHVWTLPPF